MQLLILGIDGGDQRVIDAMDMPAVAKILDGTTSLRPIEDLWSRGWAHIISGYHGSETGAFYERPKLDGTYGFTQGFGTNDYGSSQQIVPLWRLLNQAGRRIGFHNVPTTMPAPAVDGFLIAGAGGGFSPAGGLPPEACMPREAHAVLQDAGGDWETRFIASGIRDAASLLDRAVDTMERRSGAFLNLCRRYRPEVGFFVQKEAIVVQNLAMSEIQPLIEAAGRPANPLQELIIEFYRRLDSTLRRVVDDLEPKHLMVVSDHGSESRLHSVSVNALLEERRLLRRRPRRQMARTAISRVRPLVPIRVRHALVSRSRTVIRLRKPLGDLDPQATDAFGARYIPGVYVNDDRFGGPAGPRTQDTVERVVAAVNGSAEANRHGLHAIPYRSRHPAARFNDLLPDVWIEHPDTVFFEGEGPFVERNPEYGPLGDLLDADRDLYTGIKRRHPLLHIDQGLTSYIEEGDTEGDLTAAYRIVRRALT